MESKNTASSVQSPRVSVITPTYNNAHYIGKAVESVLAQTFQSLEMIVIDDGSTDDTRSKLEPYSNAIRYIYQENKGVCAARNRGIELSRGEFVAFLDADDYFLPNKLTEQVAVFDSDPLLGIVQSGWRLIDENDEPIRDVEPWRDASELDLMSWLLWKPVFPGAMMVRRKYLQQIGGFDTRLRQAEDVDLVLRISLSGGKSAWLRRPTVAYRVHGGNTIRNGLQQAKDLQFVLDKFFSHPDVPKHIQRSERLVRYSTLMWVVWQLYRTNFTHYITEYLQQSRQWTLYHQNVTFVALDWAEKLALHSRSDDCKVEDIRLFWPYFKEAVHVDDLHWKETENALNWWLNVWRHYLNDDRQRAVEGLLHYQNLPVREIIKRSKSVIFVCYQSTVDMVSRFWRDARDNGLIPSSESYQVSALYQGVFEEAVYGSRWRKAAKAFLYTLRTGFHPKASGIWFCFFRFAFGFLKKKIARIHSRGLS